MKQVLFVCTGNIFRSLTAEHALRGVLPSESQIGVSSAGTEDFPHVVRANVSAYLREKGFDVSAHRRRTLTREILDASHLVIAMSTDHFTFMERTFGVKAPLFLEACGLEPAALPDIEDVVADYQTNQAAVDTHVRMTITASSSSPRASPRASKRSSARRRPCPRSRSKRRRGRSGSCTRRGTRPAGRWRW